MVIRTRLKLGCFWRESWSSFTEQKTWDRDRLLPIFDSCIAAADCAVIGDSQYLHALGFDGREATGSQVWRHLIESSLAENLIAEEHWPPLETILRQGPLARRLLRAVDGNFAPQNLHAVYQQLGDCLLQNRMFLNP